METESIIFLVNIIIVFLLLAKFAAKPLMDFFKGRNKVKCLELSRLEAEKEKISGEIGKTLMTINDKITLLSDTEKNIIREGEIIKAEIIKEAGIESELILLKAKQEAEKEIKQAIEKLRTEVMNQIFDKIPDAKQD